MALPGEFLRQISAHEAGAAGDKDFHQNIPPLQVKNLAPFLAAGLSFRGFPEGNHPRLWWQGEFAGGKTTASMQLLGFQGGGPGRGYRHTGGFMPKPWPQPKNTTQDGQNQETQNFGNKVNFFGDSHPAI